MATVQVVLKRMSPTYWVRVVTGRIMVSGVGVFSDGRVKRIRLLSLFFSHYALPSLPSHLVPSKLKMATAINRLFQPVCVFSHLRPRDSQGNLPFAFL